MDGCLIWDEHPPATTKSAPSYTADVPNVVATAHKLGEIPGQGTPSKASSYTSRFGIETIMLSAIALGVWMVVILG